MIIRGYSDDDTVMDTYVSLQNGKKIKISNLDDDIFVGIIIRFIRTKFMFLSHYSN